jgi:hypothetical protein
MKNIASFLSATINKALLANGVQLTGKELSPVSREIAEYVYRNEDSFNAAFKSDKEEQSQVEAAREEADRAEAERTGQPAPANLQSAAAPSDPSTWKRNKGKKWQEPAQPVTANQPDEQV